MLFAFWSVKGGAGTTVLAAAVALAARSRDADPPPLLVDLSGDLPTVLGVDEPPSAGVAEWSRIGSETRPDSLGRLLVPVAEAGLDLLPRGKGAISCGRMALLLQLLRQEHRTVVIDAGTHNIGGGPDPRLDLIRSADRSVLVTRACVIGLRHAQRVPRWYSGVAVVRSRSSAIDRRDIEAVLERPVLSEVEIHPAVARAVDAGVLRHRLPGPLRTAAAGLLASAPRSEPQAAPRSERPARPTAPTINPTARLPRQPVPPGAGAGVGAGASGRPAAGGAIRGAVR